MTLILIFAAIIYFIINKQSETKIELINVQGSYQKGCANFEELIADSDLSAFVKVGKEIKTCDNAPIPTTDSELTITKLIHNTNAEHKIIISNDGVMTEVEGKQLNYVIEGDPIPQNGEQSLIFARYNALGTYTILGGPQGKFSLTDGELSSMKYVTGIQSGIIDLEGVEVTQFEKYLIEKVTNLTR